MSSWKKAARFRVGGLAVLLGVALLLVACGGSGSSSTARSPAAGTARSLSGSSTSAGAVTISTAKGPHGTYLTGASERALYMWMGDSDGGSNCSDACAAAWPPLITKATPIASGGVRAAYLGTILRVDGGKQVTYNGHPLYYFAADSGPGTTRGEGSASFAARWWLVAPSGAAITVAGLSSVGPPPSY